MLLSLQMQNSAALCGKYSKNEGQWRINQTLHLNRSLISDQGFRRSADFESAHFISVSFYV